MCICYFASVFCCIERGTDRVVKKMVLKLCNQYPEGLASKEEYVIRRRADALRIRGTDACHVENKDHPLWHNS